MAACTRSALDVSGDGTSEDEKPSSLVELRVLDGANLYFPRPAVKLTLDVGGLLGAEETTVAALARRLNLRGVRPGPIASGQRQRFAARVVGRLVRQIAAEAGASRLAVRSRPTSDRDRLVIAYPWRRRGKAEALGQVVADVLDAIAVGEAADDAVHRAAAVVRAAEPGAAPALLRPKIPVVAVTGTNGKTTTSRMIAHMARCAGLVTGWSSTDGIYVDGELVEAGDYSGPSGAGRVLADKRVKFAVTETARGGVLLRGVGLAYNDVSVVTNVSADHLGLQGVDTLDQLAEVKAVITKITKPAGHVVVNGDDPRTFAMRLGSPANTVVFSRDPDSPSLRAALNEHGWGVSVLDGDIVVLRPGADPDHLLPVVDVPMTLSGLSRFNVENALAAAAAGLAVGLPRTAVIEGLTSFQPNPTDNPGRMNIYSAGDVTVVLDLAHNEAGLDALLEVTSGLRAPGATVHVALGTAGDRTDDVLLSLGEIAARRSDHLVIVDKPGYLRGRTHEEMRALYRAGAAAVGVHDVTEYASEVDAVVALLDQATAGDVVAVMCHEQRTEIDALLRARGATVDTSNVIRAKVLRGSASP